MTAGSAQNGSPPTAEQVPGLDVEKLHSLPTEQQDIFLLTFVSELRNAVQDLSAEALPAQQASIKKEVIKIVGLGSPAPSRPVRNALAYTIGDSFDRGSRSLLYETINDLLNILNSAKGEKETSPKHVAVVCLGQIFRTAGDSAVSLSGLVVQTLLKASKTAHVGLKASCFRSLGLLVQGVQGSLDENLARDIWKSARSAAGSDKSSVVQMRAFGCIRSLTTVTTYFRNSNDFDYLKSLSWKVMDSPVARIRHAVAKTLGDAMIKAFAESSSADVPLIRRPKKSSKKQGQLSDDEDNPGRSGSPAPSQMKPSVHLSMNLTDIIRTLSTQYIKGNISNRARAGIAVCLQYVLQHLPQKNVESSFGYLAEQIFSDMLDHPSMDYHRYRLVLTRNVVRHVLGSTISAGVLTENGQISAARYLINDILKNYPRTTAERTEPTKGVLCASLQLLHQLLRALGSAATAIQDACREALCQVSQHSSHSVRAYTALCFGALVDACPVQLSTSLSFMVSRLKKGFESAPENRSQLRAVAGTSLSIAAMLRSASRRPLFGSIEIYASIFAFATDLLKRSGNSELRLSASQVEVAWTLIGGLMNLGPGFVKVHLNQLLLLWRNAMPPPLTQANAAQRNQLELSFLCHVRECALSGLLSFLESSSNLLTTDGSRRISLMLQNTAIFLANLPSSRTTETSAQKLEPALQLQDMAFMLRRRLLQCYSALLSIDHIDGADLISHTDLVGLAMEVFTSPDRPTQKSLEASLAASASNYESLWDAGDNWAFGASSLVSGFAFHCPHGTTFRKVTDLSASSDLKNDFLDLLPAAPVLTALEHDPASLYRSGAEVSQVELTPASTACVDAAIKLFSVVFPLQSARVQESAIEQLANFVSQPGQRDPGRKAAVQLNITLSLLLALTVADGSTTFPKGRIHVQLFGKTLTSLLRQGLDDTDPKLRMLSARALGISCNLGGTQLTNSEIQRTIDNIVANRDPHARAGGALTLGCIHTQVGAMASNLHLKSIVGVLLSLCSDSHPVVHYWAVQGLSQVAESAGLSFSAYAASTLGMMTQLYSNDSHNTETASTPSSNLEMEFPTAVGIAQCVDSIINVLGPDLQDLGKQRQLIMTLVGFFKSEELIALQHLSFVCLGHISMYAPAHLHFASYVLELQETLTSKEELLVDVSISSIGDLIKRNAAEVARVASNTLNDDMWAKLDASPATSPLRSILLNWLHQTMLDDSSSWVDRCRNILSRTRLKDELPPAPVTAKTAGIDLADDEVAGFAAATAGQSDEPQSSNEGLDFLRWQTREFAMQMLGEGLDLVQKAMNSDQIIPAEEELQGKVADIIRIAFSASTANVIELRIWGLRIIDKVLKMFGKTPDPDFTEASLLEQYQAQIGSALTPAFAADSSPDLAAEAVSVCATFVATGIVTSADRMGRIFKVLSTGVENLASAESEASIGDLKNLSPNAQSMLKMSLLSGWAQLQLASVEQHYLEDIVSPYLSRLAPLWLSSLQEFARLRFEPDISDTLGTDTNAADLDERYAAFNRVVRLQYYQGSWLSIVNAVAVLVDKDSEAVFDALEKKEAANSKNSINGNLSPTKHRSFREEPVAFFFILFGLAFEALVIRAREDPRQAISILSALGKILTPAVAGPAIYEDGVFNETTDTLDRLALTSTPQTQSALIEIARNMALQHPSAKAVHDREENLSDDIEQLFELSRIIVLVLTQLVPTIEDPPGVAMRTLDAEGVILVQSSFRSIVSVAEVFPSVIKADLHACVFHCYCTLLATGICQEEVMPALIPVFREFLKDLTHKASESTSMLVRGALQQILTVLTVAQRRENEYAIICAKNSLLSLTVLISSASYHISSNDELITRALTEILDCLQDVGLARIAANCTRTLLQTKPKTACDEAVSRHLWPRLIQFICDEETSDPENVRPAIIQALVASLSSIKGSRRQSAMSILLPVLLLYVEQPAKGISPSEREKEVGMRLLELATADSIAFRATVGLLDAGPRKVLEDLLRSAGVGKRIQEAGEEDIDDARPAIALRMDF